MTCFALRSGPVTMLPWESRMGWPDLSLCGTPALRKYLLTMMSVANCDHWRGISASGISKTMLPSGLVMRLVRFSYSTVLKASCPGFVKRRVIFILTSSFPDDLFDVVRRAAPYRLFCCTKFGDKSPTRQKSAAEAAFSDGSTFQKVQTMNLLGIKTGIFLDDRAV